jgi:small subunit ribosomal protein S4
MARYTGSKWKINRREGATVVGVSEKWKKRPTAPGKDPSAGMARRASEYGVQFREKQKLKRTYGMQEKQFKRFFGLAQKAVGNTGTKFLQLLELRMDNVLFRLGLAKTRAQARQMISHGRVTLNGTKHDVPSTILKPGDEIKFGTKLKASDAFKLTLEELASVKVPEWLERFSDGGKVQAIPVRDMIDPSIKERLIIEYYSKFSIK